MTKDRGLFLARQREGERVPVGSDVSISRTKFHIVVLIWKICVMFWSLEERRVLQGYLRTEFLKFQLLISFVPSGKLKSTINPKFHNPSV